MAASNVIKTCMNSACPFYNGATTGGDKCDIAYPQVRSRIRNDKEHLGKTWVLDEVMYPIVEHKMRRKLPAVEGHAVEWEPFVFRVFCPDVKTVRDT